MSSWLAWTLWWLLMVALTPLWVMLGAAVWTSLREAWLELLVGEEEDEGPL